MLRDKSYAILTLDLLDGMSDFVPSSRSADIPAPGGLGTWLWCPLPPLPSRVNVTRAAPQSVIGWDCTSPHSDAVTGTFAFLYQKPTGWIFYCRRINWYFSRWSPFVLNRLAFSQGEVPPFVSREVVGEGIWAETRVVFADWKIRRLGLEKTPVSVGPEWVRCQKYRS